MIVFDVSIEICTSFRISSIINKGKFDHRMFHRARKLNLINRVNSVLIDLQKKFKEIIKELVEGLISSSSYERKLKALYL
jgi:hypothetical protein